MRACSVIRCLSQRFFAGVALAFFFNRCVFVHACSADRRPAGAVCVLSGI